jgi:hypothetical protein
MLDYISKYDTIMLKSRNLNDTQLAIIATIRMRLTINQSLDYMKEVGFPMSRATYTRHKRKIQRQKLSRLYHIVKIGFTDEHLSTIDELELITKINVGGL